MKESNGQYKTHVFVCTNEKKGDCCAPHGAEKLRRELKEWTKQNPEWKKRIRINNSGCLDRCSEGVAIAIYPQNKWFTCAGKDDLDQLKKEIEKLMAE